MFVAGALWLAVFAIGCAFANGLLTFFSQCCCLPFSEPGHVTDDITLNVLRALQGIGGAAIVPAAVRLFSIQRTREIKLLRPFSGNAQMGILAAAFPPSQARSTAFATFGAGAPIGERRAFNPR